MVIIGISGKKGSGKDTAGLYLKNLYEKKGHKVKILKFADALKEICSNILSIPVSIFEVRSFKNMTLKELSERGIIDLEILNLLDEDKQGFLGSNTTLRNLMQYVGTELMRNNINKNIHLSSLLAQIKKFQSEGFGIFIITDLRFKNEYDFLKRLGALTIRINRSNIMMTDLHPSEVELDRTEFDFKINNNKSQQHLLSQITKIFPRLSILKQIKDGNNSKNN